MSNNGGRDLGDFIVGQHTGAGWNFWSGLGAAHRAPTPSATGDGWTGIAGLLLLGLGAVAAYYIVVAVGYVYRAGLSPYIYFVQAMSRDVTPAVVIALGIFTGAHVLMVRRLARRTIGAAVLFLVLAPPLNLIWLTFGELAVMNLPAGGAVESILVWLTSALPEGFLLPGDIPASAVKRGIPVAIFGLGVFLLSVFLSKQFLAYASLGTTRLLRWAAASIDRARASAGGRAILILVAVIFLSACGQLIRPWVAFGQSILPWIVMPYGLPTFAVVLTGMVLGWRLAGQAVVAWFAAALLGLPMLANDLIEAPHIVGPMSGTAIATVLAAMLAGRGVPAPTFGRLFATSASACLLVVAGDFIAFALTRPLSTEWEQAIRFSVLPFAPGLVVHSLLPPLIYLSCRRLLRDSGMRT